MFTDERAGKLMDEVMDLVCATFFDACGSFQCSGYWPEGKDSPCFEVRVYPSVVELLGGKHDGETVYQGFRVDLKALQEALFPLYDEVEAWDLDNAIGYMDDPACRAPAIAAARALRGAGLSCDLGLHSEKPKKFFSRADRIGARHGLLIGPDEVASGQYKVKRMESGGTLEVTPYTLVAVIGRGASRDD